VLAQALKSQIKISINPAYEKFVTPLSPAECNNLKSSIQREGQWVCIYNG